MRALCAVALVLAGACTAPESAALPYGTDAASCSGCHEAEYQAWSSSAHATSGISPVFEALVERARADWGARAADACVRCHQPDHGGDLGVGCVTCHAATGNTGTRDGRLRVDLEAPLAGPRGEGETEAHQIRTTGFLTSPSLCGTCHEVTSPGLLDEPTLSEYQGSALGAAGIGCATCHMRDGEHRFVGIDPAWDAAPDAQARAREDTRALMEEALALDARLEEGEVVVTLENLGTGHAVPTGAAFLRDLWVDVSAGPWEARALELGSLPTRDGEPVALLTDADTVTNRSLASGEVREARVPLPADASGEVVVTLNLRAIRWEVLDALGLGARREESPTIELTRIVLRGR